MRTDERGSVEKYVVQTSKHGWPYYILRHRETVASSNVPG